MPGDFEGVRIWIVGTLVILGYLSKYSWDSTKDVNILVPHAIIAIVFLVALGIVKIIENERVKADLGKRYTESMKPLAMISPATERGLIQGHRLLELEQLPPQSLSCEPQPVQSSLRSHPETFTQVVALHSSKQTFEIQDCSCLTPKPAAAPEPLTHLRATPLFQQQIQ